MGAGQGISLPSLNIRSGRAGGLDTELQAQHQGDVDAVFLQETKLMQDIYTQNGVVYNVWET